MIRLIAAVSQNGVIGIYEDGKDKLPFHYSEDMKHFKKTTNKSIVVMGRKTFESIGSKPLPKRDNHVLSYRGIVCEKVTTHNSFEEFMKQYTVSNSDKDVWVIGGASVYREAMSKEIVDEIYLTLTPDYIEHYYSVMFPWINPAIYSLTEIKPLSEKSNLLLAIYEKIIIL